uniref:Uncharacterized protein LOC104225125 n=1 Tax=Nicotiana sylvestris TaxID=4096 RepID=A0A1U7WD76_NICSY|nr:PREDICTED: uncharacterized protein LOC104225125 [Nicotiana sylvestris]
MSNTQLAPQPADDESGHHGENNNIAPDSFVKAHTGAIKVETRKSDHFKVRQKDNEMLREFVSRLQIERMDLPLGADDWAVQAFTQGLNIRVEDNQLGAPSGFVYSVRPIDRVKRDSDREPRLNRDRYQPYNEDGRNNGSERGSMRNERRNDWGQSRWGIMNKNGFDRLIEPKEIPRFSEYNFNINVTAIVSAFGCIKDTKWPRPLQSNSAQRDPNQMCKYHGTHDHKTEDCRQLKEEVARLFNNRHLREFLSD